MRITERDLVALVNRADFEPDCAACARRRARRPMGRQSDRGRTAWPALRARPARSATERRSPADRRPAAVACRPGGSRPPCRRADACRSDGRGGRARRARSSASCVDRPALHVSIAHSGEFVACALSDRRVGVDIERADRPEADDALAAASARRPNAGGSSTCRPHQRTRALIRLWARKEALAKALGVGLALPFDQLDVRHDIPLIGGVRAGALRVRDVEGGPDGYAVAIASRRSRVPRSRDTSSSRTRHGA